MRRADSPLAKALAHYIEEADPPSVRALSEQFDVPERHIHDAMFQEDWEGQRKQYRLKLRERTSQELSRKAKTKATDASTAVDLLRAQVGSLTALQSAVLGELTGRLPDLTTEQLIQLQNVVNNQSSATVQRVMDFIGNMLADAAEDSSQTRKDAVAALLGSEASPPPAPPPRRSLSVPTTQPDALQEPALEDPDPELDAETIRMLESEGARGPDMGLLKRLAQED